MITDSPFARVWGARLRHFLKSAFGRIGVLLNANQRVAERNLRAKLLESGLLDPEYYVRVYPDVRSARIAPLHSSVPNNKVSAMSFRNFGMQPPS